MKSKPTKTRRQRKPTIQEIHGTPRQMPQSLAAQILTILKDKIHSGDWPRLLPSEREICEWLIVSRGTLRMALKRLEREGFVKSSQGRRWEITRTQQKRTHRPVTKNLVLLKPMPLSSMTPFEMFWVANLRAHLQDAGYQLVVRHEAACYTGRADGALEELAAQIQPAGWVLAAAPSQVQQWFSDRKLPCVIVGSPHPGVVLPSIDRDLVAASRHAAGMLAAKGHTRLALLVPESGLAGDLACEKSFRDAAELALRQRDGEVLIVRHDGTPQNIHRHLAVLWQRRHPPTGLLVSHSTSALGTLGFLLRQGLRVPEQVALISRDSDAFMEYMVPTIARYVTDPTIFARKVSRMVLRLAQGGNVAPQIYRVMPDFVPGETLG